MSLVTNFLSGSTAELLTSKGNWTVTAGAANLSVTREKIKYTSVGSLLIEPTSSAAVTVDSSTASVATDVYYGWPLRGSMWVWTTADSDVLCTISVATATGTTTASATTFVRGQRWTLVTVNEATSSLAEGITATVKMTAKVTDHNSTTTISSAQVFVTSPIICTPHAISENAFYRDAYLTLPEFLRDGDETVSDQDYPLARFLDVVFMEAGDIYALWERIRYVAPDTGVDEKVSELADPATADERWLSWLAMILGVKFLASATGFSSWTSITAKLDTEGDGDGVPEWSEWETLPDADVSGSASWEEIEGYAPDTLDILPLLRWQVQTAIYGINAGTKEAFVEAAKHSLLGPTYEVRVESNFGGDPWHIRVYTPDEETPDTTGVGTESGTVLSFLTPTVPAGFQVSHRTE